MKKKLLLFVVVLTFAVLSIGLLTACPNGLSNEATAFINAVDALPTVTNVALTDRPAVDAAESLWNAVSEGERTHENVAPARTRLTQLQTRLTELSDAAALIAARDAAVERFNDAFDYRFDEGDYNAPNWTVLTGLRTTQVATINAMSLADAIAFDADAFNWTAFNNVETAAQEAAALADARAAAVERFTNAFNARFDENDYTNDGWDALEALFDAEILRLNGLNRADAEAHTMTGFNWTAFDAIPTEADEILAADRAQLILDFNAAVDALLADAGFLAWNTNMFGATEGVAGTPVANLLAHIASARADFVTSVATMNQAAVDAVVIPTQVNNILTAARAATAAELQAAIDALIDELQAWFSGAFTVDNGNVTFTDEDGEHDVLPAQWTMVQDALEDWIEQFEELATFVALNAADVDDAIYAISNLALIDPALAAAHDAAVLVLQAEFAVRYSQYINGVYLYTTANWQALNQVLANAIAAIRNIRPDNGFGLQDAIDAVVAVENAITTNWAGWAAFEAVPTIQIMLNAYLSDASLAIDITDEDDRYDEIADRLLELADLNAFIAMIYADYNVVLTLGQQVWLLLANMQVLDYWSNVVSDFEDRLEEINDLAEVADLAGNASAIAELDLMRGDLANRIMLRIQLIANFDQTNPTRLEVAVLDQIDELLAVIDDAMQSPTPSLEAGYLATIQGLAAMQDVLWLIAGLTPTADTHAGVGNAPAVRAAFASLHIDWQTMITVAFAVDYARLEAAEARYGLFATLAGLINALDVFGAIPYDYINADAQVALLLPLIAAVEGFFTTNTGFPIALGQELVLLHARNQVLDFWNYIDDVDAIFVRFDARLYDIERVMVLAAGNEEALQELAAMYGDVVNRMLVLAYMFAPTLTPANLSVLQGILVDVEAAIAGLTLADYGIDVADVQQLRDFVSAARVAFLIEEILGYTVDSTNYMDVSALIFAPNTGLMALYNALTDEARAMVVDTNLFDSYSALGAEIGAVISAINTIRFADFIVDVNWLTIAGNVTIGNFATQLSGNNAFARVVTFFNDNVNYQHLLQSDFNRAVAAMRAVIGAEIARLYGLYGTLSRDFVDVVEQDLLDYDPSIDFDTLNVWDIELFSDAVIRRQIVNARTHYEDFLTAIGATLNQEDPNVSPLLLQIATVDAVYQMAAMLVGTIRNIDAAFDDILDDLDLPQEAFTATNWQRIENARVSVVQALIDDMIASFAEDVPQWALADAISTMEGFDYDYEIRYYIATIPVMAALPTGSVITGSVFRPGTYGAGININMSRIAVPTDAAITEAGGTGLEGTFFGALRGDGIDVQGRPTGTIVGTQPAVNTPQDNFIIDHVEISYHRAAFDSDTLTHGAAELVATRRLYWQWARYGSDASGSSPAKQTHTIEALNLPETVGNIRIGAGMSGVGGTGGPRSRMGWLILTRDADTTLDISPYTGAVRHSRDGGVTWSGWVQQPAAAAGATAVHGAGTGAASTADWIRLGDSDGTYVGTSGAAPGASNWARGVLNMRVPATGFLNHVWLPDVRNNSNDAFSLSAVLVPTEASNLRRSAPIARPTDDNPATVWGSAPHSYLVNEAALVSAVTALGTNFANVRYASAAEGLESVSLLATARSTADQVISDDHPIIMARQAANLTFVDNAHTHFESLVQGHIDYFAGIINGIRLEGEPITDINEQVTAENAMIVVEYLVAASTHKAALMQSTQDAIDASPAGLMRDALDARLAFLGIDFATIEFTEAVAAIRADVVANDGNIRFVMAYAFNPLGNDAWNLIQHARNVLAGLTEPSGGWTGAVAAAVAELNGFIQDYRDAHEAARLLNPLPSNNTVFVPNPLPETANTVDFGALRPGFGGTWLAAAGRAEHIKGAQVFIFPESAASSDPANAYGSFWIIYSPAHGLPATGAANGGIMIVLEDFFINPQLYVDANRPRVHLTGGIGDVWRPFGGAPAYAGGFHNGGAGTTNDIINYIVRTSTLAGAEPWTAGSRVFRFAGRYVAQSQVRQDGSFFGVRYSDGPMGGFSVNNARIGFTAIPADFMLNASLVLAMPRVDNFVAWDGNAITGATGTAALPAVTLGQPIFFGIRSGTGDSTWQQRGQYVRFLAGGVPHIIHAPRRAGDGGRDVPRIILVAIPGHLVTGGIFITGIYDAPPFEFETFHIDGSNMTFSTNSSWGAAGPAGPGTFAGLNGDGTLALRAGDGDRLNGFELPTPIRGLPVRFAIRGGVAWTAEIIYVHFTVDGIQHYVQAIRTTDTRDVAVIIPANLVTGDIIITTVSLTPPA